MRDTLRLSPLAREAAVWSAVPGDVRGGERWRMPQGWDPPSVSSGQRAAPGWTAQRLAAALLVGRQYRMPGGEGTRFADALVTATRGVSREPMAGGALRRIDQTDPAEYDSLAQARLWGGSTCSAAALTMVLRAQGKPVRIADVLRELGGGITVQQGLVSRPALVHAAARFGLQARDEPMSYDALQRATASGQPVLVDITNARFPEGHWIVVTGADAQGVSIVDSSGYRLTRLSREEFVRAWSGRGVRILHAAAPAGAPLNGRGG